MKTNLKTRPTITQLPIKPLNDILDDNVKLYDWFSAFTIEIHQQIVLQEPNIEDESLSEANRMFVKGYVHALKDVLGEKK